MQTSSSYVSMEVLKYERQMLDQQILRYKGKLTPNEEEAMKHKSELLARRVEETREALRKGGVTTLKSEIRYPALAHSDQLFP
jgi:hypothetical protein